MFIKPSNWSSLNPEEKKIKRLEFWEAANGISFDTPEAEAGYRSRIKILRDAVEVNGRSRVPAFPVIGRHITKRAGITGIDTLYHHDKLIQPILDFHNEFQPDTFVISGPMPGRVWDILDYKVYNWAGHGLTDDQVFQTLEGEYMKADEYAALIQDPSGFWIKHYLPRVLGALAPLKNMVSLPTITEIGAIGTAALPFGIPEVREMVHKLLDAGEAAMQCFAVSQEISRRVEAAGFPSMFGPPFCSAPFDMIGDVLRGTQGMMTDLHRRPAEVIEACERLVPIVLKEITGNCDRLDKAFATFPLHKGADAFMSDKQFRTMYWPTLRAVMEGLNEEGITPVLFAEGSYNNRLEIIADYPKGRAVWFFDQTDMRRVRDILGGHLCVQGNVPSSLMCISDTDKLRKYCEELLELFNGTGGFILANGAVVDNTTDEHVRILIDAVR